MPGPLYAPPPLSNDVLRAMGVLPFAALAATGIETAFLPDYVLYDQGIVNESEQIAAQIGAGEIVLDSQRGDIYSVLVSLIDVANGVTSVLQQQIDTGLGADNLSVVTEAGNSDGMIYSVFSPGGPGSAAYERHLAHNDNPAPPPVETQAIPDPEIIQEDAPPALDPNPPEQQTLQQGGFDYFNQLAQEGGLTT